MGPVVSKLTMSLVNDSLKFQTCILQILLFFLVAKDSQAHFFSTKSNIAKDSHIQQKKKKLTFFVQQQQQQQKKKKKKKTKKKKTKKKTLVFAFEVDV